MVQSINITILLFLGRELERNVLQRSIVPKLNNLFGDPNVCIAIEQRGEVLRNVLNIAIPIIIVFSLFNYLYQYNDLALVQLGSLVLIIPAWFMTRRTELIASAESLALYSTAVILLFLIYDGGIAGLGFIWGWLFPFIAFYIAGIRLGWYWCIGFFIAASIIFMLSLGITASYDADTRVLFFSAYLFYLVVGLRFNAIRFQYLFDLEKQVQKRTAQLEHASLYDALTDMPNRGHVTSYLQALIDREKKSFALLNLNIDRFNELNNVLGYNNGDRLLMAFADRISSMTNKTLFAGRLGADEFAVILQQLPAMESNDDVKLMVLEKTKQLKHELEQPYMINDSEIELDITTGIEFPSSYNNNASHMIKRANFACHLAKKRQDKLAVYDSEQDEISSRQFHLFHGLKHAIENHELKLFYQPKIDMQLGKVTDVEALIRWISPEDGLIHPNQFIPVAESTGLMHLITKYVLDEAMQQQSSWIEKDYHINIAVNLSANNLVESDFISSITAFLNKHKVSPDCFTLEITESAVMEQTDKALQTIHDLNAIGFSLSLDDYGTGYTSLSYLKDMPVDELKIDQSFIFNVLTNEKDRAIIQSTISLADNLDLKIVAEGIESREVWDKLKEMGCDKGQGYFIAKPMPAEDFSQWLKNAEWPHS